MSSIYTNLNINAFNRKQARMAAVNTGVITPTSNNHGQDTSKDTWINAVKAKQFFFFWFCVTIALMESRPEDDHEPMPNVVPLRPELELAWRGLTIVISEGQMTRKQAIEMLKSWEGEPPDEPA